MLLSTKQKGMTLIGWLFMMGFIGFFAILVLRLWPIYYENFGVKRAVAKLPNQPEINSKTDEQIWKIVERQFTIDQVNHPKRDNFTIERLDDGRREASVKYEVRVGIMFNVDAVVYFDEKSILPQPK